MFQGQYTDSIVRKMINVSLSHCNNNFKTPTGHKYKFPKEFGTVTRTERNQQNQTTYERPTTGSVMGGTQPHQHCAMLLVLAYRALCSCFVTVVVWIRPKGASGEGWSLFPGVAIIAIVEGFGIVLMASCINPINGQRGRVDLRFQLGWNGQWT